MTLKVEPISYKLKIISNWNIVANKYHKKWADPGIGPFAAAEKLIDIANIQPSDYILDVGCGTGALTKKISNKIGRYGKIIGIDISREALSIANSQIDKQNIDFIEMDAEKIYFRIRFSKIISQFAVMFFTNPIATLNSLRNLMTKEGQLVFAVHGAPENVPYFNCIMKNIVKSIPDIIPNGSPSVHSLGDHTKLYDILTKAGFTNIQAEKYLFSYSPGTFEQYWNNYMECTANSIKHIIEKDNEILCKIKNDAQNDVLPFINKTNNKITFPWEVLVASAYKH
jgi:ubiquinone/menaquinone biosynthesis C-methylase UbiE